MNTKVLLKFVAAVAVILGVSFAFALFHTLFMA